MRRARSGVTQPDPRRHAAGDDHADADRLAVAQAVAGELLKRMAKGVAQVQLGAAAALIGVFLQRCRS